MVGIQIKGAFAPLTLYNSFQLLFFLLLLVVMLRPEHITNFIKCKINVAFLSVRLGVIPANILTERL